MKNNGLVFLGFVLICLVNISANKKSSTLPKPELPDAKIEVKPEGKPSTDALAGTPAAPKNI